MNKLTISFGIFTLAVVLALPATAHETGADPQLTGAPGESDCTACHGTFVNANGGNVKVVFPDASYKSGQIYRIQVIVTDLTARRWGFELTPRKAADPARVPAGTMSISDTNTQVRSILQFQWITHTFSGTRPGTTGPTTFEFDWTAPAAGTGDVTFYAAANAANNNRQADEGDHIYTTSLTVPEAASAPAPTLRDTQPAIPSFLGNASLGFASNAFLELYGSNLAGTSRVWSGSDFNGPNAPTSLEGVSVKVNGKDAFINYVSPTQVNINTPDDPASGPVSIQLTYNGQTSNIVTVNKAVAAPALLTTPTFNVGGRQYVVGFLPQSTAGGPFVGQTGLIVGIPFQPVKPNDIVIFYALGCGPTNPATSGGVIPAASGLVTSTYELKIGGVTAQVDFFGVIAGLIGLYQINAHVPNVGVGDQAIELVVNGVTNSQNLFLSGVQN